MRMTSCQEHIGADLAQLPPHSPPTSALLPRQPVQDTVWFWERLVARGLRASGNSTNLSLERGLGEISSWLTCVSDIPDGFFGRRYLFYMRSVSRDFLLDSCQGLGVGQVSTM